MSTGESGCDCFRSGHDGAEIEHLQRPLSADQPWKSNRTTAPWHESVPYFGKSDGCFVSDHPYVACQGHLKASTSSGSIDRCDRRLRQGCENCLLYTSDAADDLTRVD